MTSPYIGITDFMSARQSYEMADFFDEIARKKSQSVRHKLMVGVASYYETLNDLPSEWTDVIPKKEDIADIFIDHPRLFNTIHYVDFEGRDTLENLIRITEFGGKHVQAIQLDMVWPEPDILTRYRVQFPHIQTLLQINTPALDALSDIEDSLIRRIASYGDALDFVLLDKSMGRGLGMDREFLRPLVRRITEKLSNVSVAVAGGLGPDTMHLVEPLIKEFSNLSIDAEAQLRQSKDAHDPVNWKMAKEYLQRSLDLFYPETL